VDFLAMQKEEAGFSGKELEVEIELEENRQLRFDPDLLGRAIENLLQNAFAYGRPGTPVTISCRQENGKINFSIANQIESAPEEDELPLLFEPFYRGDSARHGDGFGLGLASVKSIVDAHGWSISARLRGENVLVFMIEIL
jgi:signal transduction histidine kinase